MTRARLTPKERRERARLRAVLDRLAWQLAELRSSLERCAGAHAAMAVELIS